MVISKVVVDKDIALLKTVHMPMLQTTRPIAMTTRNGVTIYKRKECKLKNRNGPGMITLFIPAMERKVITGISLYRQFKSLIALSIDPPLWERHVINHKGH